MNYYLHKGEVYAEDGDGPATYSEARPRNARRITEAQARDHFNRVEAENEADHEARQEQAQRDRDDAAAEAAQKRQALADWLAESGAPPEVATALLG